MYQSPFSPNPEYSNNHNNNNNHYRNSFGSNGPNSNERYNGRGGRNNYHRGRGRYSGRGRGFTPRLPGNMLERSTQIALPPAVSVTKDLLKSLIANEDNELSNNIQTVAEVLLESGDLENFSDQTSDLFVKFLTQLSVEASIIITLLGLISKFNRKFPKLVLDKVFSLLVDSIQDDDVLVSKMCLRVFACLTSCKILDIETLLVLLSPILSIAQRSLGSDGRLDPQAQVACYLLASTIPWCVLKLNENEIGLAFLKDLNSLFDTILSQYRSPYNVGEANAIFYLNINQESEQDNIPSSLSSTDMCSDAVKLTCELAKCLCLLSIESVGKQIEDIDISLVTVQGSLTMPWMSIMDSFHAEPKVTGENPSTSEEEGLAFYMTLDPDFVSKYSLLVNSGAALGSKSHLDGVKPIINYTKLGKVDQGAHAKNLTPAIATTGWLTASFKIYDRETLPNSEGFFNLSTFQKIVCAEYVKDILRFFEPYLRDDGQSVGSIEVLIQHLLGLSKLFPAGSHIEICVLETLLCMVLQPPPHYPALIHRVFLGLCRELPNVIPVTLATGISNIYSMVPVLETSSWRQLCDFLSFHLNNFDLAWPYWNYWVADYMESIEFDCTKLFLAFLIDKITRGAFPERMKASLPESLHALIPNTQMNPFCFAFKRGGTSPLLLGNSTSFINTRPRPLVTIFTPDEQGGTSRLSDVISNNLAELAADLFRMVDEKEDPEDIETWMEEIRPLDDYSEAEGWRGGLFIQAILLAGQNILSTTGKLMEKYKILLRDLTYEDEHQKIMFSAFVEALSAEPATFHILLDNLLRKGILNPSNAASYLYSPEILNFIHIDTWIWSHAEVVVERSLDLVMAAYLFRKKLLDSKHTMLSNPGGSSAIEDQDQTTGTKKRRLDEDEVKDGDGNKDIDLEETAGPSTEMSDQLNVPSEETLAASIQSSEETLAAAVSSCSKTYTLTIGSLLAACSLRYYEVKATGSEEEEDHLLHLDPNFMSNFSLLKKLLRLFHGTERELINHSKNDDQTTYAAIDLKITSLDQVLSSFQKAQISSYEGLMRNNPECLQLPDVISSHIQLIPLI